LEGFFEIWHQTRQAEIMKRNIPSPRMRDYAQQLLAYEAAAHNASELNMAAVFRVFEALRRPLSTLAGASGFRALLVRALMLAKAQVPSLSAVQVKPDGSLEGLNKLRNNEDAEAGVVLIAQLLGLLVAFIGESLMLRILLDVWPGFTIFDARSS
jgi:hypothetical protein